jgi:hypothetical protein
MLANVRSMESFLFQPQLAGSRGLAIWRQFAIYVPGQGEFPWHCFII